MIKMKQIGIGFWMLAMMTGTAFGQEDSALKKKGDDTLYIGKMIIIRKGESTPGAASRKSAEPRKKKPSRTSTNWLTIDLGVNGFKDATLYNTSAIQNPVSGFAPGANEEWFDLQNGKSINFNLWVFMQRTNIIRHVVNLQYGLGVEYNNYRFSSPIVFTSNPTRVLYDVTTSYSKNKLATNYLTIPLMVNFRFTPERKKNGFGFSAGISTGYLFNSRQKTITGASGKNKSRDDFDLRPWKFAYIGELQLGPIKLYGSLADRSMFEKGLDFTPYNVGFRINSF